MLHMFAWWGASACSEGLLQCCWMAAMCRVWLLTTVQLH